MLQVKIKQPDVEKAQVVLSVPEVPAELRLSNAIDYELAYHKFEAWLSETDGQEITLSWQLEYLRHLSACVQAFCDTSETEHLPVGNLPAYLEALSKSKEFDYDTSESNLLALYANCLKCFTSYEKAKFEPGKAYTFEYKGDRWQVPASYRDVLTNQKRFEDLPLAQTIEGLEAWRKYEEVKENDAQGNLFFTTVLNTLAVFARKENEVFPDDQTAIDQLINERLVYFQDIDMQVGFDVIAFFLNTPKPSESMQVFNSSSIRRDRRRKRWTKPST